MSANMLTLYILIWPVLSAGVLALLVISLVRDMRKARKSGKDMV
ncbi:putative transporter small subunit [Pusillimonas sp. ANT_WB101]|nr:putative transporter small subunit [Pusillimonas sp. ANT_WB101]